ncbi:type 2 isopentenyl-diphosphate Delta-isomerase [Tumebacillus permanentifrigoris]|uniref:Isopentenyl-diphosphate delta-isomerase n=1 Tax=Tumebacillus permanentifrigoris TaxID=378543 RepID=A0A316DAI9_9BACL|nr:type 2 isopentenyl-diphosphate Delta-isomerase [Tumebacillus permanentifrigoris]PWK14289.1 isopentenyl-diphosphate delta-isomerase [Tumebacillus permanentifrigoris]
MSIEQRKLDHVRYALALNPSLDNGFSDLRFVHRALPDFDLGDVTLATTLGGLSFSSPLLINAMTGGAGRTEEINRGLAEVAKRTGLAMAVGSQRAALKDPALARTYSVVRDVNPAGLLIANLGAGASLSDAQRAVEMIGADLMHLHLNAAQELTMPEGDRSFRGLLEKIQAVVEGLSVPVIVKEVGNGMSAETYRKLAAVGVRVVDVAGMGGTNFVSIENRRRSGLMFEQLEREWGQTTAVALLEAQPFLGAFDVIGSGGVQSALDVAKCLALGANVVGVAGAILRPLMEHGIESAVEIVEHWHEELRVILTLQECHSVAELRERPLIVRGQTAEWSRLRGIDLERIARRGL